MRYQDNQHFTHHHILVSLKLDEGEKIKCNGCEQLMFEPFHGCLSCNYYLHDHCLNIPRGLQHPSHPSHPLTLLPNPTYSSRSFTCNACGSEGKAFNFCCAHCEFDLHVTCASLPITVLHDEHPHELKLIFQSPYNDKNSIFECSVCHGTVEGDFWRYYCADCDFGTHLNCATAKQGVKKQPIDEEAEEEEEKSDQGQNMSAEEAYRDAQRNSMENHLANKLMLQALDNAGEYVGSSHTRYYYY